jgi:hypothetical protein
MAAKSLYQFVQMRCSQHIVTIDGHYKIAGADPDSGIAGRRLTSILLMTTNTDTRITDAFNNRADDGLIR